MIPFDRLSKEPLPDSCRCRDCDGSCSRRVRKRWFQCNPCSKKYHGVPCAEFQPNRIATLVPECDECGLHNEEH